jgi:DNA-binding transcriptional LysR family regulator
MTIQQFTYLLEVYETGSFSAAAKNLIVSQSAVSNAVLTLEKEIGAPIFIRGQHGLTLTIQGEDVIRHAKRICESVQHLTGKKEERKKSVRVGCANFEPANLAFVRLLQECQDKSDIEFSFEDGRNGDGMKRLINYELDITLYINFSSYNPPARMETIKENDLTYEELATIPACVCIGKGHPLFNKPVVQMDELRGTKVLVNNKNAISSILPAYLPVKKSNALIAQGYGVRQRILESGQAFHLRHMPSPQFQQEGLRYIPIEKLHYVLYMVTNPKYPLCPEAIRYIELLKEEVKKAYH